MEKIKETLHRKLPHHEKKLSTNNTATAQDDSPPSGFEVLGTMHTRSRQNTTTNNPNNNPTSLNTAETSRLDLERHISQIPQHDEDHSTQDYYDGDNENAQSQSSPPAHDAAAWKHEASPDFEEPGLLRILTSEGVDASADATTVPAQQRLARLERTISQIPIDDYDSDVEVRV